MPTPTTSPTRSANCGACAGPPLALEGAADRFNHRDGNDDYTQPGNLFRLLKPDAKARLMDNIAAAMQGVPNEIVERKVVHFTRADPAYGAGVAQRMGVAVSAEAHRTAAE